MVLVWAWGLVASQLMLPNSTEVVLVEEEEWATWALEVTFPCVVSVRIEEAI